MFKKQWGKNYEKSILNYFENTLKIYWKYGWLDSLVRDAFEDVQQLGPKGVSEKLMVQFVAAINPIRHVISKLQTDMGGGTIISQTS